MSILGILGISIGMIACAGITALSLCIDKHPEKFNALVQSTKGA
jgi:hypothetical protein